MANVFEHQGTDSEAYERQMGRWSRRMAGPFLAFVGNTDGASVLDVGCGPGILAFELARSPRWEKISGIDTNAQYVETAIRHGDDPRIDFRVGDATDLPYEDSSYDQVMSQLVLQFVPQADTAISEMIRVARPGATIAATTWNNRGGYVAYRMFFDTAAVIDPEAGILRARLFSRPLSRPGELAAAWKKAGLVDVEETQLIVQMEFDSFDDFWDSLGSSGHPVAAYRASVDEDLEERIRLAVRNAYLDGEDDGPRTYGALAWAVKGTVSD